MLGSGLEQCQGADCCISAFGPTSFCLKGEVCVPADDDFITDSSSTPSLCSVNGNCSPICPGGTNVMEAKRVIDSTVLDLDIELCFFNQLKLPIIIRKVFGVLHVPLCFDLAGYEYNPYKHMSSMLLSLVDLKVFKLLPIEAKIKHTDGPSGLCQLEEFSCTDWCRWQEGDHQILGEISINLMFYKHNFTLWDSESKERPCFPTSVAINPDCVQ